MTLHVLVHPMTTTKHVDESSNLFSLVMDQYTWAIAIHSDRYRGLNHVDEMKMLLANPAVSTWIFWAVIDIAKSTPEESPAHQVEEYYVPDPK